jgi:hypothetical protein
MKPLSISALLLIITTLFLQLLFTHPQPISAATLSIKTYRNSTFCVNTTIPDVDTYATNQCLDYYGQDGTKFRVKIFCNLTAANVQLFETISGDETDCNDREPIQSLVRALDKCFPGQLDATWTSMSCDVGKLLTSVIVTMLLIVILLL